MKRIVQIIVGFSILWVISISGSENTAVLLASIPIAGIGLMGSLYLFYKE